MFVLGNFDWLVDSPLQFKFSGNTCLFLCLNLWLINFCVNFSLFSSTLCRFRCPWAAVFHFVSLCCSIVKEYKVLVMKFDVPSVLDSECYHVLDDGSFVFGGVYQLWNWRYFWLIYSRVIKKLFNDFKNFEEEAPSWWCWWEKKWKIWCFWLRRFEWASAWQPCI